MIALLMSVSKMSQQYVSAEMGLSDRDAAAERLSRDVVALMRLAQKMFPAGDMEQQVVTFARRIGFEIQVQYIGNCSKVPQ